MPLISAKDFLNQKDSSSSPVSPSKGLISASEFLKRQKEEEARKQEAARIAQEQQTHQTIQKFDLPSTYDVRQSPLTKEAVAQSQEPTSQLRPYTGGGVSVDDVKNETEAFKELPSEQQDRLRKTVKTGDKKQNSDLRKGFGSSPASQAMERASEFTTEAINAAALGIPKALAGDDKRADYEKTGFGTAGKLAGELFPISKAYKLVNPLFKGIKNTVARSAARGATVGAGYGTAKELADAALDTRDDDQQSIGKRALNVGTEAALFAAGDAALSGGGAVAKKVFKAVKARRAGKPTQGDLNREIKAFIDRTKQPENVQIPNKRIEETVNLDNPRVDEALDSFKRREEYQQEYKQAIEDQYIYLKSSMKNRGGVTQGNIIRDQHGDVVGRTGRISNNPQWYQAIYKANGRAPTNGDLRKLAKEHVDKGYQDDMTFIPPWRPKDITDIDDELRGIQEIVSARPEMKTELDGITAKLQKERDRLKRVMPESVSAMATKTADGRPLLERGTADVGIEVGKTVTKRSDVIADLAKSLNIPIRTGRFRQKAHGIHKTKSNVVRSKLTNDVPVIAHEVGHALDKRYQLSSAQFDSELQVLGQETSRPSYSKTQVRNEGVAEFFRLLLTDPAKAQTSAPNFYARFTQKVSQADKNALMSAQAQIRQYMDQDILTKSFSEMSVGKRDKRQLPSLSELYTKFVDDLNPIKQMLKPLGEKGKRVFENFWLLRGASGRAQAFLKQGRVDEAFNVIGKSFDDILKPVKSTLNEFRTYIKDKRAIELDERGIMTGSDLTTAERSRQIQLLEQRFPQFKQVHQELKEYQDALLKELIDSGMLTADDVATFKEVNKEYVPFFRVFESEAGAGAAKGGRTNTGSGAADQRSPIKRIKGSDREIVDPLESIIKNTYQYITIAERNKSMRDLIDAVVNAEDMGGLVEKIPTPMQGQAFSLEDLRLTLERQGVDVGALDMDAMVNIFRPTNVIPGKENIITVFRNGKREFYQLDPDLYRAVTAADKEQMNFLVRAANMPVRLLRSGIVNTLEFWLRNVWRDQFSALINSQNGYIPYIDLVRGMYHVLGKTDTFTKFLSAGGAQGLRQSLDRKYLQSDMRSILATSMKDKSMNILRNPLEAMRALSELSELGTRVGEFSKGIKKDGSAAGIKKAAVSSRDLIDFGRAGTMGREINKISAFWNAQIQGLDKTIRVFSNPKTAGKAFMKATALITAPTAALYEINKNDPRYQELPDWDKDMYWHFWVGDKHFRVPIPFELGVVFKVLPERLMRFTSGEENSFDHLGQTAFNALNPIPSITALMPWIQAYANKTFFGTPIVPRREQDLPEEDQSGPYTSGVAKLIAKIPGVRNNYVTERVLGSPRKIDHIIQGYTGSLGKYATQLIDKTTDLTGITSHVPKPATGLEDKPGFKAIMGKPFGGSTNSIDRFYERLDKLDRGAKEAEKRNQYFEGAGELKQFQQIRKSISQISKQIRAIQSDPNMSAKEKTKQIRQLNVVANNYARMALGKEQLEYEDVFK